MKALTFDENLRLTDVPTPEHKDGEALIKITMAGICNTDLEIIRGYMGFRGILGHEFIGKVEEATNAEWIGKRVVGDINIPCRDCEFCRKGLERHCYNRTVLGIQGKDGVFAEYVTLPEQNLHHVPDGVSDKAAVFVEPLAASLEILQQVKIDPASRIAIIGDGKLGLMITQVLTRTGCELVVIGKNSSKLATAKSFGASTALVDSHPQERYDSVVEASGSPNGFALALELLKPRGTMILKSTYHEKLVFNPAEIVINEMHVVGSRCGVFAPAIRLLEHDSIDVDPFVTKIFPFTEAETAFEIAQDSASLKVILDFR
jgi:threonine dehydrogenase-like Zn-dependent dehydrogenase